MPISENLHKAAVLLSSLPSEQQTQLLSRLEPQQAAAVVAQLKGLREVSGVEQVAVVRDFAGANHARLRNRRPAQAAPFAFLDDLSSDTLLSLISDEHPQTIALVLSHLSPSRAAAILAKLTPGQQFSVVCRIATMSEVSPEVAGDVERTLRKRLSGPIGRSPGSRGLAGVVKMLNRMDPAVERGLLGTLAKADPQLVRDIRRAMFGDDVAAYEELGVSSAAG